MMRMVVLEKAELVPEPEFCVHGHTFCVTCGGKVWLGSQTLLAVQGGALPMCQGCARLTLELKENRDDARFVQTLDDTADHGK